MRGMGKPCPTDLGPSESLRFPGSATAVGVPSVPSQEVLSARLPSRICCLIASQAPASAQG